MQRRPATPTSRTQFLVIPGNQLRHAATARRLPVGAPPLGRRALAAAVTTLSPRRRLPASSRRRRHDGSEADSVLRGSSKSEGVRRIPSSVGCAGRLGVRMRNRWTTLAGLGAAIAVLSSPLPSVSRAEPPDWVGGRAGPARLGGRLPAVASRNSLSAAQLRSTLLHDESLFVDADNHLIYVDPPVPPAQRMRRDSTQTRRRPIHPLRSPSTAGRARVASSTSTSTARWSRARAGTTRRPAPATPTRTTPTPTPQRSRRPS